MSRIRLSLVIALIAVCGAVISVSEGGVEAKPKPAPGGKCLKAGRVISVPVSLVCKQTVKNGLRWRKAPTPAITPVVTLIPSISLEPAFITGGTFPKAVVVTSNVAGTVYFAEGAFPINKLSDITSADANRWTSGVVNAGVATAVPIDVTAVLNGYYRVYVANSQGVLSAPASNIVTISVTRVSTVAVAVACADGGVCALGDTGPGGGVVFYVHASGGTFACGETLASTCKYLEAAPANWLTGTTSDPSRFWATNVNSNQTTAVTGAAGTAVGSGYKNSLAIVAQTGNVAATSAAVEARAYRGPNNLSDWFLPSKDELNKLYLEKVRVGSFSDSYWSSSEVDPNVAWGQHFYNGFQGDFSKVIALSVRPVRAFGGTVACADGGVCALGDIGPGGGVVYILSTTSGNTTGLTFEAARNDWNGSAPDGTVKWCAAGTAISGLSSAIGSGSSNSATMATSCSSTGADDAAEYVRGKTIGGKTDWFLPSRDEALAIYAQRSVFTGAYATNGTGVDAARYLTSTQGANPSNALGVYMAGGVFPGNSDDFSKTFGFAVRPVRSFTAGS
jgi:hypothetical protein